MKKNCFLLGIMGFLSACQILPVTNIEVTPSSTTIHNESTPDLQPSTEVTSTLSSLPTSSVEQPTMGVIGIVVEVAADHFVITDSVVGSYTLYISSQTEIWQAEPESPITIGDDITVAGVVNTESKTVIVDKLWVNVIHLQGDISNFVQDADGYRFQVEDPRQGKFSVILREQSSTKIGVSFDSQEIQDYRTIDWSKVDIADVFGVVAKDKSVVPMTLFLYSRKYLFPDQ